MANLFKTLLTSSSSYLLKRSLSVTSTNYLYKRDGNSTLTLFDNNIDNVLMIKGIYVNGFLLNNGVKVIGPMIMFPKTMLCWNIASSLDMNEESFSLLLNLEPKLDIFIIGLDDKYSYNTPFLHNIKELFRKYKILTEILPVYHACATFNFINHENRYGAAALIPPKKKNWLSKRIIE
ncbi:PREDICTED: NADH dehydrogenase [ubiquinone] 1 alpha subcomplex assembly factor 3 [Ceratosolen solmsi marchali]|uniref:NADH dehydrogenase [ubiquinone] 1 alpha subcomplex assembly factor 3 n=1 Tax=Ceratosolen solmsi marchali TaxID=326594 RepID=A0AAJ6YDC3_9HYME|nr:PREDICTED: NADH dehydrogenase [ubiquinone] 1 alpha subcomplex assembly factor 3 [Ceratosolen solmsi marchali]